ncbi:MAG: hypothetical protein JAY82_17370, partial [Candidatus Thiodiazotropha taylori]|nr:hypothetical protein [Candidatus Thiodiazotropha taylori]
RPTWLGRSKVNPGPWAGNEISTVQQSGFTATCRVVSGIQSDAGAAVSDLALPLIRSSYNPIGLFCAALVKIGVYNLTRNSMCLGMAVVLIGASIGLIHTLNQ